jgi:HPt (histidine-containing phosphotransfer) domain-containing protein
VFLADNSALVSRIEAALSARNYHEVRSLLHAVKGSSASMGTDRLTRVCESFGRLSDPDLRVRGQALLRAVAEELAAARSHLEQYLREKKTSAS